MTSKLDDVAKFFLDECDTGGFVPTISDCYICLHYVDGAGCQNQKNPYFREDDYERNAERKNYHRQGS